MCSKQRGTVPRRHSPQSVRDGEPVVDTSARLKDCRLGRFCEIGERVVARDCVIGDYTYMERLGEAIHADIGKFCAIAAAVRLNALNHPMERVSQHRFTYRPNEYFLGKKVDGAFRRSRRETGRVHVGHDVWIGHGAIVLPGVRIGDGAVIGAGAVVAHDVSAYAVVAGVPAHFVRWRFEADVARRLIALAWWHWDHDRLADAVDDMRQLSVVAFLDKYDGGVST